MSRSTRSRTAKAVDALPKITDHFAVTRGPGPGPSKNAKELALDQPLEINALKKKKTSKTPKTILVIKDEPTEMSKSQGEEKKRSAPAEEGPKPAEKPANSLPVDQELTGSPPKRPRPTEETVESNPVARKPARSLFGNAKEKQQLQVQEEVSVPPSEPVQPIVPPVEKSPVKVPSASRSLFATEKSVPTRKPKFKNVHQLQERLAELGAARLHAQAKKTIPVEKDENVEDAVPKSYASPIKKVAGPIKIAPIAVKTPKKTVDVVEEEEEETSMTRAPSGYGDTLLKEEVKSSAKVQLPTHYRILHECFVACDRVLSFFNAKNKTASLASLEKDVRTIVKRINFDRTRFAQLLSVYPQAYRVVLQKSMNLAGIKRFVKWDHIVHPNLDDDLKDFLNTPLQSTSSAPPITTPFMSPSKLMSPMKGRPNLSATYVVRPSPRKPPPSPLKPPVHMMEVRPDTRPRLEGWRLSCRQQVFRHKLAERVRDEHNKFLQGIGESPVVDPRAHLLHPTFSDQIDSLCPAIAESTLECPPDEDDFSRREGVKEFLERADTITKLPGSVQAALEDLKSPEKAPDGRSRAGVPLTPSKFQEEKEKEAKPMSLMERIRAKEAARKRAEQLRDPAMEERKKKIEMLLDRQLLRLFKIYESRAKHSMELKTLAEFFEDSGGIAKETALSLFSLLTEVSPSVFTLAKTSLGDFLKVSDHGAHETVKAHLTEELGKCEKAILAKRE